jgi:hypothetical protein
MRIGSCTSVVFAVLVAGLSGCTGLPSLEPIDGGEARPDGSISINEVVKRVKCELYDATRDVKRDYWWFRYWGAKVDLDLVVNEQAGLTPSIAILNPMQTVYGTIGSQVVPAGQKAFQSFTQTFSLGLSGGYQTQAIRTESVSFSTTFLEVRDQLQPTVIRNRARDFDNCKLPEGSELNGNLGLKQWIVSALGPVKGGDEALLTWGGTVVTSGGGGGGKRPKSVFEKEPPVSVASKKCNWKPGSKPLKDAGCRPPIDSITHSIEFTVVKSAGITPGWTLMRFRGQTGNGSMASTSRVDTHKLTVSLGPAQEDLGTQGVHQSLRLLAPTISNALSQAQTPR